MGSAWETLRTHKENMENTWKAHGEYVKIMWRAHGELMESTRVLENAFILQSAFKDVEST